VYSIKSWPCSSRRKHLNRSITNSLASQIKERIVVNGYSVFIRDSDAAGRLQGLDPESRAQGFVLMCVGHADGDVKLDA
jgi:hypothetical protein